MKTLYLLRHAKSSWKDPSLDDFDRPLNKRGKLAGRLMGRYFHRDGIRPDMILCSAAKRAQMTLGLVAGELGGDIPTEIEDDLYMAGPEEMVQRLAHVGDSVDSVMIIGHNPGIEHLAVILTGDGDGVCWQRMKEKYPTAALSVLTFDIATWRRIEPSSGTLVAFVCPRDFE